MVHHGLALQGYRRGFAATAEQMRLTMEPRYDALLRNGYPERLPFQRQCNSLCDERFGLGDAERPAVRSHAERGNEDKEGDVA